MKLVLLLFVTLIYVGCSCSETNPSSSLVSNDSTENNKIYVVQDTNVNGDGLDAETNTDSLFGSMGSYFDTLIYDSSFFIPIGDSIHEFEYSYHDHIPRYPNLKSATKYTYTVQNGSDTSEFSKVLKFDYNKDGLERVTSYEDDSNFFDFIALYKDEEPIKYTTYFDESNSPRQILYLNSSKICYDTTFNAPDILQKVFVHYKSIDTLYEYEIFYTQEGEFARSDEYFIQNIDFDTRGIQSENVYDLDGNAIYTHYMPWIAVNPEIKGSMSARLSQINTDTTTGTIASKKIQEVAYTQAGNFFTSFDSLPESKTVTIIKAMSHDSISTIDTVTYTNSVVVDSVSYKLYETSDTSFYYEKINHEELQFSDIGYTYTYINTYPILIGYPYMIYHYPFRDGVSSHQMDFDLRPIRFVTTKINIKEYNQNTELLVKEFSIDEEPIYPINLSKYDEIFITEWKYEFY